MEKLSQLMAATAYRPCTNSEAPGPEGYLAWSAMFDTNSEEQNVGISVLGSCARLTNQSTASTILFTIPFSRTRMTLSSSLTTSMNLIL